MLAAIDKEMLFFCLVGVGFCVVCLFVYVVAKDRDTNKRLQRFEGALTSLAKEIYKTQKGVEKFEQEGNKIDFLNATDSGIGTLAGENVKTSLQEKITSMSKKVNELDKDIDMLKSHYDEKIISLENKLKEYGHFTSGGGDIDEKKIVEMFQTGFSIDSIAKQLRIGRGEVEFTLKLANISSPSTK
ncbi:DUF6115 domain-containing protein [Helicobacter sp. T3_23-1056]